MTATGIQLRQDKQEQMQVLRLVVAIGVMTACDHESVVCSHSMISSSSSVRSSGNHVF
jgi:hypothetical protein